MNIELKVRVLSLSFAFFYLNNKTMEEELISFDTAVLAKEKGFNERCLKLYNLLGKLWVAHYSYVINSAMDPGGHAAVCTQALLQKWLREKHNVHK